MLSGVDGSSDELLLPLLSFFERLKNNSENKEKQPSIEQDSSDSNKSKNEVIEETKPKKRKGLRR